MDLQEAKRIMRLVADDESSSGRAREGQETSARVILAELERLEKENERLNDVLKDPSITFEVSGGMVQNVYTNLDIKIEVDVMDFDDAGSWTDQERDELEEHRDRVVAEQKVIY